MKKGLLVTAVIAAAAAIGAYVGVSRVNSDTFIDWYAESTKQLQQERAEQVRNANPFDAAAASVLHQGAQAGRPDQASRYPHLAKYVDVPVEKAQARPEITKQQAALRGRGTDHLARYGSLAKYLTDPDNAAKSPDKPLTTPVADNRPALVTKPAPNAQPPFPEWIVLGVLGAITAASAIGGLEIYLRHIHPRLQPAQRWHDAPTEWRLALAAATVWAIGVVVFTLAFGTQEYYRPEDKYWHIVKTSLVPAVFGTFCFWIIQRARRK